jgi:hypothetical protein
MVLAEFLAHPGSPGAFGAMMDEYARAADAFCNALLALGPERYEEEQPTDDAHCASPHRLAAHCCRAAWGYSRSLREALDLPGTREPQDVSDTYAGPAEVRAELSAALRDTEEATAPLRDKSEKEVSALTFRMPWGQLYDPEILLEHAIVHLLRHRRQIERW